MHRIRITSTKANRRQFSSDRTSSFLMSAAKIHRSDLPFHSIIPDLSCIMVTTPENGQPSGRKPSYLISKISTRDRALPFHRLRLSVQASIFHAGGDIRADVPQENKIQMCT